MGMGGDPHFMVLLQDLHSLCYSVQGMAGFPFNLVSSRDFVMNAVFINAQYHVADYATYLGEIGIGHIYLHINIHTYIYIQKMATIIFIFYLPNFN